MRYEVTNTAQNLVKLVTELETAGNEVLEARKASKEDIKILTGIGRKRAGYLVTYTNDMDEAKRYKGNGGGNGHETQPEPVVEQPIVEIKPEVIIEETKETIPEPKKRTRNNKLMENPEARSAFEEKYPWAIPDTYSTQGIGKATISVECRCVECQATYRRNVQDVFQSSLCAECRKAEQKRKRNERARRRREAKKQQAAALCAVRTDDNL
jgi:hypothetical protein